MAGNTNFLVFNPDLQNILTDLEYLADDARKNGAIAGTYHSNLHNKFAYQLSAMVAGLAQMMAAKGYVVNDGSAGEEGNDFSALVSVLANLMTLSDIQAAYTHHMLVKTEDYDVLASDMQGFFTICNMGAAGSVDCSLPPGSSNAKLDFLVTEDGRQLGATANGTEQIRYGATLGAPGGSISSSQAGDSWTLKWTGTLWQVCNPVGNLILTEA